MSEEFNWQNAWDKISPILVSVNSAVSAGISAEAKHQQTQKQLSAELRRLRKKRGISLRSMAKSLKIKAPYLSDLERGNRNWSQERAHKFLEILTAKK